MIPEAPKFIKVRHHGAPLAVRVDRICGVRAVGSHCEIIISNGPIIAVDDTVEQVKRMIKAEEVKE